MSEPSNVADFVAVEAAGKLAGISPRTLRHWIATVKLPAIPGKRGKLVRLEEVRRLAVLVGKEPLAGNLTGNAATSADMVAGNAADPVAGSALVSPSARAQLEAVRDEWFAPLIAQITEQAERIGRLEAERDGQAAMVEELRRRAEAAEAEADTLRLRLAEVDVPAVVVVAGQEATAAPRATATTPTAHRPAHGLWRRLRRALRRG